MTSNLKRVVRLDSIKLNATYFTDEGYLIDHPIVTTCGIFEYTTQMEQSAGNSDFPRRCSPLLPLQATRASRLS